MNNKLNTHLLIHTDGSCIGNPGPGGWAAIIQVIEDGQVVLERELCGTSPETTTNNRMEMQAAISALRALFFEYPALNYPVTMRSDSRLLVMGMSEWTSAWERRGWRKADGKPVENADLWKDLCAAAEPLTVQWQWVRGHAGDSLNNRADALAREAAQGPAPLPIPFEVATPTLTSNQ